MLPRSSAGSSASWKRGLDGLDTYHPGQKATVLTPALPGPDSPSATRKKPSDGSTHWSCRKLASALGVSKDAVHRVLERSGPETPSPGALLSQRRSGVRKQSDRHYRPVSAASAACYPAVFCVDEKTAIQALDRLDHRSAAFAGTSRARHGFEYYLPRNALSLYAALDTQTGRVHGRTTARHTSRDFVAFLEEVLSWVCSPRQQLHIILDNLSAHKTQLVRDFLQQHPRVQLHFTPTYSSWLQPEVEIWFAKIEREVIARGIFHLSSGLGSQTPPLHQRLLRQRSPDPKWKYSDLSRRLRTNEFTATVH